MKHLKWLAKSAATFWIAGCGIATAQQAPPAAPAQSAPAPSASAQTAPTPMAWRLECLGDGKVLECQTMQSLINRDDGISRTSEQLAELKALDPAFTPFTNQARGFVFLSNAFPHIFCS